MTKSRPRIAAAAREVLSNAWDPRGEDPDQDTRVLSCPRHYLNHIHPNCRINVYVLYRFLHRDDSRWVGNNLNIDIVFLPFYSPCENLVFVPLSGYPTLILNMNLSNWASGRGYVPSCSTGFCVAIVRKGAGSLWVTVPMVTCFSCMASNKAA